MKEKLQMTVEEADRLSIMKQIDKNVLTLRKASEELGISLRQVKRVRKCYLKEGKIGLISGKRGKRSNRKIADEIRARVMNLLRARYADFGPTLLGEKLAEQEGLKISRETLRTWMVQEGLWKAKRKKEWKIYSRRVRRSRFGELLQGDGSPHDWFEGRGPRCTLLQFVDDATGKTTAARFETVETTDGYLRLLKEHVERYGKPLSLYVDKHSVFRVNRKELKGGKGITRFGQVMKDLDIELICAHSPQAKGRVERKNGVMQDRLAKEMRLRELSTMEEGNAFLPEFLESLNQRFGKEPRSQEDAHRLLANKEELGRIFLQKETRKLSKDLSFQYKGDLYFVQTKTPNRLRHALVEVQWKEGDAIQIWYRGTQLGYKRWEDIPCERPLVLDHKELEAHCPCRKKPGKHHPWR